MDSPVSIRKYVLCRLVSFSHLLAAKFPGDLIVLELDYMRKKIKYELGQNYDEELPNYSEQLFVRPWPFEPEEMHGNYNVQIEREALQLEMVVRTTAKMI